MTTFLVLALLLVYEVQVVLPVDRNGSSEQTTSSWLYQWRTVISAVAVVIMGWFLKRLTDVPTVEIHPNFTVEVGESVELNCVASAFPCIKSVSWKHILPDGETKQLDLDQQKYTSTKPNHIVINKTLKSDEREYVCIVSNWFGKTQSKHTKLTVKGGCPTLKLIPKTTTKTEGDVVVMHCSVTATPPQFKVMWTKEENQIPIDNRKYFSGSLLKPALIIDKTEKECDEGEYTCMAENIVGSGKSSARLIIQSNPASKAFSIASSPNEGNIDPDITYEHATMINKLSDHIYPTSTCWPKFKEFFHGILTPVQLDKDFHGIINDLWMLRRIDYGCYDILYRAVQEINPRASSIIKEAVSNINSIQMRGKPRDSPAEVTATYNGTPSPDLSDQCSNQIKRQFPDDGNRFIHSAHEGSVVLTFTISEAKTPHQLSALYLAVTLGAKLQSGHILLEDGSHVPLVLKTAPTVRLLKDRPKDTPTVVLSRRLYQFEEGKVGIVKCVVVDTLETESIEWFIIKDDGQFHAIHIDNLKYFCGSLECPSLVINDLNKDDRGVYFCRVGNTEGEGKSNMAFVDIKVIVKDTFQLSQPIQTRRPSTVTNTIIKEQFAMTSNVNDEVATLHNIMVLHIGNEIFGEKLDVVKELFRKVPLNPADISEIKNIPSLFNRLMDYKTIDYGNYQKFVSMIRSIHPNVCLMVRKYAEEIKKLQGNLDDQGPSLAKQPKTEDRSQQQSTARQEDMAANISVVPNRQEDMAKNISVVYNRLEDMARDMHNLKGDLAARNVTTASTSHAKKIHPDLEPMIETAKARIKREKEKKFYPTKGFCDAKEKLQKNRVVVIRGNTGDGKTAIAVQLLHWLSQEHEAGQPLQIHKIKNLELLAPNLKLFTFIDDIFGEKDVCKKDVQEWDRRISDVKTLFVDEQAQPNFLIITIRNEVFNSLGKGSFGTILTKDNIIDLSSKTYKLAEEEKELLELYKPKNFSWTDKEKTQISTYAPTIGFPQCCQLFYNSEELQKKRVNFFENPSDFLNEALSKLQECSALLYLFLNGGMMRVKDLDPNTKTVDEKLLEQAFSIKLIGGKKHTATPLCNKIEKIGFIKDSFDELLGFLVKKEKHWSDEDVYRFNHDSIYVAVALLYGKATPIGYIQNCPRKSLSYLTTSERATNMIVISSDHYTEMCERLLREFECEEKRYGTSIGSLDVWNDPVFVERFVGLLNDRKVDKLAVLNKACYFGAEECALYLLSEGVKPDKDTALSLVSSRHWNDGNRQVCLLRKVVVYLNVETKLDVFNKACSSGAEECALYLLSKGVKPDKDTALSLVSGHWNDSNKVCLLRKIGVYLNDETKVALLNKACYSGAEECALYLLCEGVEPDKDIVFGVVERGSVKVLRKLLEYDVTLTARDKFNNNVLYKACLYRREEMVTLLCDTYPHLVHDTGWCGQTPLYAVAQTGNCSILQILERCVLNSLYRDDDQQHKCESVNGGVVHRNCVCAQYMAQLVDVWGRTVLHYCCWGGNREICLYLCRSYPALTTAVDNAGRHWLHYLAWYTLDVDLFTECESHVKQYLESTGRKYDITTILDNKGESVLDRAKEGAEICETENNPLLDHLIKVFGK